MCGFIILSIYETINVVCRDAYFFLHVIHFIIPTTVEQSRSSEGDNSSAGPEVIAFSESRRFVTLFARLPPLDHPEPD
jgi:hypothetical protein